MADRKMLKSKKIRLKLRNSEYGERLVDVFFKQEKYFRLFITVILVGSTTSKEMKWNFIS